MFAFKHRTTDHPTQMNFEQLAAILPGRQYAVPFNLAAGAGAVTTVTLDDPLRAQFIPVGAINYVGAIAFQDTTTWAYRVLGPNSIEIALHNNGGGAAVGTLFFAVLGLAA